MRAAEQPPGPLDARAELHRCLAGRGMAGAEAERAVADALGRLRRRVGARCAELLEGARLAEFARLPAGRDMRCWLRRQVPSVRTIVWEELTVMCARLVVEVPPALVNLTPHPVLIKTATGVTVAIPPSGRVARCRTEPDRVLGTVQVDGHSVPLVVNDVTSAVLGLPEPEEGVLFVVSRLVALAAPLRRDMVFPHDPVRDETGRTTGCRALAQVPPTR
ncbi:MAG: hypothetical protein ABR608_04590 [Pseudonocardiaceae bacterium]